MFCLFFPWQAQYILKLMSYNIKNANGMDDVCSPASLADHSFAGQRILPSSQIRKKHLIIEKERGNESQSTQCRREGFIGYYRVIYRVL